MVAIVSVGTSLLLLILKAALDTLGIDSSSLQPERALFVIAGLGYFFWRGTVILDSLGELGGFTEEYVKEHATSLNLLALGGIASWFGFVAAPTLVLLGYPIWGIITYVVMVVLSMIFEAVLLLKTKSTFKEALNVLFVLF